MNDRLTYIITFPDKITQKECNEEEYIDFTNELINETEDDEEVDNVDDAAEWLEENDYETEVRTKPKYIQTSRYFYGTEIPEQEIKDGYISYYTLASAFDCVRANDIMEKTAGADLGYWEIYNGYDMDEEGYCKEIFQEYIIDLTGKTILQEMTDEIVYYNEELDMYVWCITHLGTPWNGVSTGIPIKLDS